MKKHIIFDLDHTLFDTHGSKRAHTEVNEVLRTLTHIHDLSLLTAGHAFTQWAKIKECGLVDCFKTVMIVHNPEDKSRALNSLIAVYPVGHPRRAIVVGDRVDLEIAFANKLGCTSVWIRRGKHAARTPTHPDEQPTHTIESLVQLAAIVDGIV